MSAPHSTVQLPADLMRFDQMQLNPTQQYQILNSLGFKKGDQLPLVNKNQGGLFPFFLNSKDGNSVLLMRPNQDGSWIVTRGGRKDMETAYGANYNVGVNAGDLSMGRSGSYTKRSGEDAEIKTSSKAEDSQALFGDKTYKRGEGGHDTPKNEDPSLDISGKVTGEVSARHENISIGLLQESGAMTTAGIDIKYFTASGEAGGGLKIDGKVLNEDFIKKLQETYEHGSLKDLAKLLPLDAGAKGDVCVAKDSASITFRESPVLQADDKVAIEETKVEAGACVGWGWEYKLSDKELRVKAGVINVSGERSTDTDEAFSQAQIDHIKNKPSDLESLENTVFEKLGLKDDVVDNVPSPIPDKDESSSSDKDEPSSGSPVVDDPPATESGQQEPQFSKYWFDLGDKDQYVNLVTPDGEYQRMPLDDAIKAGLVPKDATFDNSTQYDVKNDGFLNDIDTSDRTESRADRIDSTIYPEDPVQPGYGNTSDLDQSDDEGEIFGENIDTGDDQSGSGADTSMDGLADAEGKSVTAIDTEAEALEQATEGHAKRAESAAQRAVAAAQRAAAAQAQIQALLSGGINS